MRIGDRPICTEPVEMPCLSADGLCQADNDIHDLLQDSSGEVGPRGTSAHEPVSSRPCAIHNDGTTAVMS
jgi:hypothetical protein